MENTSTLFFIIILSFGIISFTLGFLGSTFITRVRRDREITNIRKFSSVKRAQYMITGICIILYSLYYVIFTNRDNAVFTIGIIVILGIFEIMDAMSRKYIRKINRY